MGRDNREIHGGLGAPPVDCTQKKGELGGSTVNGDYVICSDIQTGCHSPKSNKQTEMWNKNDFTLYYYNFFLILMYNTLIHSQFYLLAQMHFDNKTGTLGHFVKTRQQ